jgi:hypothetical protein
MDRSLMAAASDLTSQPRDKEEVIEEVAEASVEVAASVVIAEEEEASVEVVDSEVTVEVAEDSVAAVASEAIVEVVEASVEVAVAIATEAVENTELVHSVSDMPIRKF